MQLVTQPPSVNGFAGDLLRVHVNDVYEISTLLNPQQFCTRANSHTQSSPRSHKRSSSSAACLGPAAKRVREIDSVMSRMTWMTAHHKSCAQHTASIVALYQDLQGARTKMTPHDHLGEHGLQNELQRVLGRLPALFKTAYPYVALAHALEAGDVAAAQGLHRQHHLQVLCSTTATVLGQVLKVSFLGKACITPGQTHQISFLVREMQVNPNAPGILECSIEQRGSQHAYRSINVAGLPPLCMVLCSQLSTAEKVQNVTALVEGGADALHGDEESEEDRVVYRVADKHSKQWFEQHQKDPSQLLGFREVFIAQRAVVTHCDVSALHYAFALTSNLVARATQVFFAETVHKVEYTILDELLVSALTEKRACHGSLSETELKSLCAAATVMVSNGIGWSPQRFAHLRATAGEAMQDFQTVEEALNDAKELRELMDSDPVARHTLITSTLNPFIQAAKDIVCMYSPSYTTAEMCFIQYFPQLPLYRPVPLQTSHQIVPLQIN